MIDIYQTQTMLAALAIIKNKPTFLRDRYFPTTDKDIFVTEDVLLEYKDKESRKMAPCVIEGKGGINMGRTGYHTERMAPANVAPERTLTIDTLKKKQFGESLFSQRTPAEREAAILRQDMIDLNDSIDTREEYMSAQTIFENGYSMKHYADKYGSSEYEEYQIRFYEGAKNEAVYTPASAWSRTSDTWMSDLEQMARILKQQGYQATDVLMGADVADVVLHNEYLLKLLDNRRLNIASIEPAELPSGVTYCGRINCKGIMLDLYCYDAEFTDEDGETKSFIPAGKIAVTAPNMGHTMYGAVTQMEEQDRKFYTYPARRVPHITTNAHDSIRTLTQQSKPLVAPWFKDSAISATVI